MKFNHGDIIECLTQTGIGDVTVGKIYVVYQEFSEFPCFLDDKGKGWNLTNLSVFYNVFKIVKKRGKFHR